MPQYVVISPVRNEESHIEKTLESIAAQTIKPVKWLIVDDGSSDQTADMVEQFIKNSSDSDRKLSFIEYIKRPQNARDESSIDRIAKAAPPRTFNFGQEYLTQSDDSDNNAISILDNNPGNSYIVKLDGDLSFAPDYFEKLIHKFDANPRLGIASGISSFPQGSGLWTPYVPSEHVLGCSKIYRRQCFNDIGGIVDVLGWDTIDEIKAQMLGWETQHFKDVPLIHWRMMGSRTGFARGKIRHGFTNYYLGYHPIYMLARVLRRFTDKPYGINSALLATGYLKGWLTRTERFPDDNFRKYLRDMQLKQIRNMLR